MRGSLHSRLSQIRPVASGLGPQTQWRSWRDMRRHVRYGSSDLQIDYVIYVYSNDPQLALQLFKRDALGLRVDKQDHKELQYHHRREEREGRSARGLRKNRE